jgi:hypothetical protein
MGGKLDAPAGNVRCDPLRFLFRTQNEIGKPSTGTPGGSSRRPLAVAKLLEVFVDSDVAPRRNEYPGWTTYRNELKPPKAREASR